MSKTFKCIIPLFILFFFIGSVALSQSYPKKNRSAIRILTYNTHYCKGESDPGEISLENTRKVASVIRALDADIVALQELDNASKSRGYRNLLQQIADVAGKEYSVYYGKADDFDHGSIGCGVLVKKTIPVNSFRIIPLPGDERRAVVSVESDRFVFMGTHFDLNDTKRKSGAEIIRNEVKSSAKPVFLAGDLNDSHRWPDGGIAFPRLLKEFSIISDTTGNSLPGYKGNNGLIDYILLRDPERKVKVGRTHIVRSLTIDGQEAETKYFSDHYPVFADVICK